MNRKKWMVWLCVCTLICALAGCTPAETASESPTDEAVESEVTPVVLPPQIKSSDTVMPLFFDISLYDEENYSNVYLGKKYKFKITYAGSELTVPTTYKEMTKKGWNLTEESGYVEQSTILAGETVEAQFINEYDRRIIASFYNDSNSSVRLSKCNIVKLNVQENSLYEPESVYDQFWINGVTNQSAITDVIEFLGAPSHFYAVTPTEYYLDYFLTADDKRNGITVYISIENDCINSIEVADYR